MVVKLGHVNGFLRKQKFKYEDLQVPGLGGVPEEKVRALQHRLNSFVGNCALLCHSYMY